MIECAHLYDPPLPGGQEFCGRAAYPCSRCKLPLCPKHRATHSREECDDLIALKDDVFMVAGPFFVALPSGKIAEVETEEQAHELLRRLSSTGKFYFVLPTIDGGWTLSMRAVLLGETKQEQERRK